MEESYANAYFGKPLADITLDDLNHFFDSEHEETDTIEFKSYYERGQINHNHKESGALKTICAFLNSGGGLLIWGAPSGRTPADRQTKVFTGELSPVEMLYEKDTFVSKLASRIIPLSNLVKMHRVEVEAGRFVYLFDVAQSIHKPHQFDNRYWIRLDGQTGVAPHYLIDALFKQISYPNLGGYIRFENCYFSQGSLILNAKVLILNHSKFQNEHDIYFLISTTKGQFLRIVGSGNYMFNDSQVHCSDMVNILTYSQAPFRDVAISIPQRNFYEDVQDQAVQLTLQFGGKVSPMKQSQYVLTPNRLGVMVADPRQQKEIKDVFSIEKVLNAPMNEAQMSEEERVRAFLGD